MRNEVQKMGESFRFRIRNRIETSHISLLVLFLAFFFSSSVTTNIAASSSSYPSTAFSCIDKNNNGSMIQEEQQQEGKYCVGNGDIIESSLITGIDSSSSSSRMLPNLGDPFTGNTGNKNAPNTNCGRGKPYVTCFPQGNSPKAPSCPPTAIYRRGCPR